MIKDRAAPKAKPNDKKKAIMAPAVSASCERTFLQSKRNEMKIKLFQIARMTQCVSMFLFISSLGPEAHAETGQISITEGKQDHEQDERCIMMK